MYGIYANILGILMVNVTIYSTMDPMGNRNILDHNMFLFAGLMTVPTNYKYNPAS